MTCLGWVRSAPRPASCLSASASASCGVAGAPWLRMPVEEAHRQIVPSARSRSSQSASGSSRPTESRRRPGGTRVPSQRDRASMRDVTAPRLVAFTISRVPVSTRSCGVGVVDVEREEAAEAGVAHGPHGRVAVEAVAQALPRTRSVAPRAPRASRARAGGATRCRPRERGRCGSGTRAAARRRPRPCTRPLREARRRARPGTSSPSGPPRRSRAPAAGRGAASPPSSRTPRGPGCVAAASKFGIVRNGFDGASSQTRSTPSGGAPVWSNSTLSTPQRPSSSSITPVP